MIIKRNNKDFELTEQELQSAYDEWRLKCAIEDIENICTEYGIDKTTVNMENVAKRCLDILNDYDPSLEIYWDLLNRCVLEETNGREGE